MASISINETQVNKGISFTKLHEVYEVELPVKLTEEETANLYTELDEMRILNTTTGAHTLQSSNTWLRLLFDHEDKLHHIKRTLQNFVANHKSKQHS